ncbi:SDR family oxidoreductase [bacterium]|nr:SDR family oxidoreductase [bacterium]
MILPPPGEDDSFWKAAPYQLHERLGSLEEITDAALYLLQSGFVTGQVLYVDGGRHMKNAMYGA